MAEEKARLIRPDTAPGRVTSGGGDLRFFVQKPGVNCGVFTIPPGRSLSTRYHQHPGDEVYFVFKGPAYVDLPEEEDRRVEIPQGCSFYIPAGTRHVAHNLPGKEEIVVFWVCTDWP